jgi:hypothetical protein
MPGKLEKMGKTGKNEGGEIRWATWSIAKTSTDLSLRCTSSIRRTTLGDKTPF